MTLETSYNEGAGTKKINVIYLIVDNLSLYNIILGRLTSTRGDYFDLILTPEYTLLVGRVVTIQGD